MRTIEFKDELYPVRNFLVDTMDEGIREIVISIESLHENLRHERDYNESMGLGRSIDEQDVDDQIYFFVHDNDINLDAEVICTTKLNTPVKLLNELNK
jgi:hypothetical protein